MRRSCKKSRGAFEHSYQEGKTRKEENAYLSRFFLRSGLGFWFRSENIQFCSLKINFRQFPSLARKIAKFLLDNYLRKCG